ncbi:MAG TPA: ABC transporter ATP-binding protein [Stellaceae bacterium]|nr:ABC transporter ATP-binding protein [Stellaceae bacterium]
MTAGNTKLSIRGATKHYGSVVALADATLELREGEFLTLLGPSGSGKTTLLMMVAGLVPPSSGEVWIDGKLATYAPPNKRDIGIVFQNYALFPHLTVRENIAFPLQMRRVAPAQIEQEVKRVLDIVQLPHVASRLPRELSGGQQQRIALARCMVYRPSIILMDEPLGALDRQLRDQMQLEIKELHARLGITVLYVTHDQEEAMAMSDRICLMNNGRIEQIGSPQELYFQPRSVFVAKFLGESNILDATVGQAGATMSLAGPSGIELRGCGDGSAAPGESVDVIIRPERLRLLGDAETADNVATGVLREIVFAGGVTRYFVGLPDGSVLSAKQLNAGGQKEPKLGETVRVGWSSEHALVLRRRVGAS